MRLEPRGGRGLRGQPCPRPHQRRGTERKHHGDAEKWQPPPEVIHGETAQQLPRRYAEYLADEKARQYWLAALVGHDVTDPGHGEWYQWRCHQAGRGTG